MSKVRHLSGPKIHTIEHLQPHVAQMLAAAGLCEIIRPNSFAEFMKETNPPAAPPSIEWGIRKGSVSSAVAIIKRCGSDTTFFATPPLDCPPSIAAQFQALTDDDTAQQITSDYANMLAQARHVGDSGKHRPVCIGKNEKGESIYINHE